jgi:hypothetical protein
MGSIKVLPKHFEIGVRSSSSQVGIVKRIKILSKCGQKTCPKFVMHVRVSFAQSRHATL